MAAKTKPGKSRKITLRIVVTAPAALQAHEVGHYVIQAVDGWSGAFGGDDPRREITVVQMHRRGWIHQPPDGTEGR